MNKSVLISIQPKWCELIASGKKTIEIRKTKPNISTPFKCYIYCTLPPKEELFMCGSIREYANELIRLQDGRIVYDYGMRVCYDIENRPYSQDNFLCKKVIGEFVCDGIDRMAHCGTNNNDISLKLVDELLYCTSIDSTYLNKCQLSYRDIVEYANHRDVYGWHISGLVIYDKPKKLSKFRKTGALSYDDWLYGIYNGKDENTYEKYLLPFKMTRPPQSWCYVEELK